MQNIREVLRNKEQQAEQLQKEIEALRFTIRILEQEENPPKMGSASVETMPTKDNGTRPNGTGVKQFP
jgi:prefoldin subunit 5